MVDNALSVGILSCSKNPADARDKNIQQRAKSLSLARASYSHSKLLFWGLRLRRLSVIVGRSVRRSRSVGRSVCAVTPLYILCYSCCASNAILCTNGMDILASVPCPTLQLGRGRTLKASARRPISELAHCPAIVRSVEIFRF